MQNSPTSQAKFFAPQSLVPQVITTKDLQYFKDQMSWLLLASKKCAHFANECEDPSVRQAIEQVGQLHQRHYATLLAQLSQPQGQAAPMAAQSQTFSQPSTQPSQPIRQ